MWPHIVQCSTTVADSGIWAKPCKIFFNIMSFNPESFSVNHSKTMTQQGFNGWPPWERHATRYWFIYIGHCCETSCRQNSDELLYLIQFMSCINCSDALLWIWSLAVFPVNWAWLLLGYWETHAFLPAPARGLPEIAAFILSFPALIDRSVFYDAPT